MWAAPPARAADFAAGVDAGYAFRSQDDGRNHGVAASAFIDIPLPGPLLLRPELSSLGFGASAEAPASLGFFGASLGLVYSFDDSDIEALGAAGPLAGLSVDAPGGGQTVLGVHGGALVSVGLRFPVAGIVDLDARVMIPVVVVGPRGVSLPGQPFYVDGTPTELPLQAACVIGFALAIERMFAGAAADGSEGG